MRVNIYRVFSLLLISFSFVSSDTLEAQVGETRICKWKDDKIGSFTIGADDALNSQLDNMVPELSKRDFVATFWIVNKYSFTSRNKEWRALPKQGFDFANHSWTHRNIANIDEAEEEIKKAAEAIRQFNPSQGRLLLWCRPGGTNWGKVLTQDQENGLLKKYGMAHESGGPYNWGGRGQNQAFSTRNSKNIWGNKSFDELKYHVDKAINKGVWSFLIFHGIGGDHMKQDLKPFVEMLEYMEQNKDKLWFPTCTQAYKYAKEYQTAKCNTSKVSKDSIVINLSSDTDPELFDYPLSLITKISSGWKTCKVTQNGNSSTYPVKNGEVMYEVLPNKGEIKLTKAIASR
ncbi:MAG: polysaccharide deacetylase family protein [Planctomycetes bacterium]|nr:polysaccharide deacetylase family protein [Planctomycetota bacterium]